MRVPFPYDVTEAVGGEWIALRAGYQIGGAPYNRSGASYTTFPTKAEAEAYCIADAGAIDADAPPCPSCGSTEPDCTEECEVRIEQRRADEAGRA